MGMKDMWHSATRNPVSRHAIARRAYLAAGDELRADAEAGRISWAYAAEKHKRLTTAYNKRRDAIELSAFLGARGFAA